MKHFIYIASLILFSLLPMYGFSDINITPYPKQLTQGKGTFSTTNTLTIQFAKNPGFQNEAIKFANTISSTTSIKAKTIQSKAQITLIEDATLSAEAYNLTISTKKITIKASTPTGLFYAFQTIKKLLPHNVAVGVSDPTIHTITLPALTINDEPRFAYRGFMLDVSRHFFSINEIKHILNLMAIYKMNKFHWHLTDDQGWRIEIKQYPRLTTIGSKSQNCRFNDMKKGPYWINDQYGPYYYTQQQIKELIAYAKELHIDIVPEIDMPGHFSAAMAAYPDFSCNPLGQHNVQTCQGGVWDDVLNVANPKAIEFATNILSEVAQLFPYQYIHIGGDECPTTAWEKNQDCQKLYASLQLKSYRQLQSNFISQICQHLKLLNKKPMVWNESITAQDADLEKVKQTNATIMAWHPCQKSAEMATQLNLPFIITEYHSATGSYYINRKQSTLPTEPSGAGNGDDTVERCYNYLPIPTNAPTKQHKLCQGVQGTFWTEWVSDLSYLEYLALPRLIAIAETGWTPQSKKDFKNFTSRMASDTTMLNIGGYKYAKHIFDQNK